MGGSAASRGESHRRRLLWEWLIVGLSASAIALGLFAAGALQRLDNLVYDALQRLWPPAAASATLVEIDEPSLAAVGQPWPWPLRLHVELIQALSAHRPRAIVYLVLFTEPSQITGADEALAEAVRSHAPVFLPSFMTPSGASQHRLVRPIRILDEAAAGVGVVNAEADADGVLRRLAREASPPGAGGEPLAIVVQQFLDHPVLPAGWPAGDVLAPFAAPADSLPRVSAQAALVGGVPRELIEGRTLIVGVTAAGIGERFTIPTREGVRKVTATELQAQFLAALDQGRLVRPAPVWAVAGLALALLWTLMAAFVRLQPRSTLAVATGLALGAFVGSALLLRGFGWWLPPAAALAAIAIAFPLWGWRRLAATSDFLTAELAMLRSLHPLASPAPTAVRSLDVVLEQTLALDREIAWIEDMRRFASDIIARLPDAVMVTTRDGLVSAANAAAERMLGVGAEDLAGAPAAAVLARLKAPLAALTPQWPGTAPLDPHEAILPDGRHVLIQAAPLRGPGELQDGWIIRLADTTALHAVERHREGALHLLSHDLRAPVAAIVSALRGPEARHVDEALRQHLFACAERALSLANGFVHLARAEAAKIEFHPVDFCDIVVDAVDEVWRQAQGRQVVVNHAGRMEGLWVEGDAGLLFRAVVNLLGNAVKFSPPGSEVEVRVGVRPPGERTMAELEVVNEGPGIDPAKLARLFEPFYTGASTRPTEAIGLGLPFVKIAAERHGGAVECTNPQPGAVTFVLQIPLSERATDFGEAALPTPPAGREDSLAVSAGGGDSGR